MNYQYDLADFKRYLHEKNSSYRVDGLIFWQNRIPLPIDLFNRIFDESDLIVTDFIYQVTASAVLFSNKFSFEDAFDVAVTDLPKGDLARQNTKLSDWLTEHLPQNSKIVRLAYEAAELLGLEDFEFSINKVAVAIIHQGKKYSRLFIPVEIKNLLNELPGCESIGQDNTDMFGNIIADRYNIYRSGFSDALAIIFNALLEFRMQFSNIGGNLSKIRVIAPSFTDVDVRMGKTTDGSLWEPGYDDDHFIILNKDHPMIKHQTEEQCRVLAEFLFFLGQYENVQFSDQNKKFIENLRQTISRTIWIKHD
ncbi:hypothetical protein F6Q07_20710 [Pectobacterium parmentieri]|uniref:hypothetical protein n=1 Tax=Pectobacterium TaxID=122277 RepID=UPI000B963F9B|nr:MULTISPECIES: hypothetical protein [Pectobacterium]MBI0520523.1 hypothetical protein [Pectobacterium parmentieri]OYN51380.1 hypothetical protein B7L51_09690 [Pectobacterium carotovorum]